MLPWRRLHRDPGTHACLRAWDQDYKSPASIAARRLFKNLGEMRAFFQMMLPGTLPMGTHRYIVDVEKHGPWSFDPVKTLSALEYLEAESWSLEPAAFLVHGWNCAAAQSADISTVFREGHSGPDARRFVRYFDDIPYVEMMKMFRPDHWLTLPIYTHRAMLYKDGVPAEYIGQLTESLDHRDESWMRWDTYTIKRLYGEGVPAEYIREFWDEPKEFRRLWDENHVPGDFALGCRNLGLTVGETIAMCADGIPLEYLFATKAAT